MNEENKEQNLEEKKTRGRKKTKDVEPITIKEEQIETTPTIEEKEPKNNKIGFVIFCFLIFVIMVAILLIFAYYIYKMSHNTNNKERNNSNIQLQYTETTDKIKDGDESNSITNQKELIEYYLKNEKNIKIYDVYADDGYTGTDFDEVR